MTGIAQEKKQLPFLVKLLCFIGILYFLDFAIGNLLKHFYFKQDSGLLYRTTFALDSTRADVLIFGSSTANHHYVPDLFAQKLHLSCYNAGRDGNSILYSYAILQGVLKRYTPKMIILDVYDQEFKKLQSSYDRISSLLPYYDYHPEIKTIIQLKSPFEKYKLLSKIYPFNSMLFTIAVGNADFNKDRASVEDRNGYIPLANNRKVSLIKDTSVSRYELDSTKINFFKSFISDCNKLNIPLYVFVSPKFIKYKYQDTGIAIVNTMAQKFNIPFYNFTNDSSFQNHKNLFFDKDHLDEEGANIFTEKVIARIKESQK